MKNLIGISFAVAGLLLTSMFMNDEPAWSSRKVNKVSKPIPSSVMKIAERSCVKCHSDGGDKKALKHLNLSNWDKFSPGKQAKKATEMRRMVSLGKMPPKDFRVKNPDAVPTNDEIMIIGDWANSVP